MNQFERNVAEQLDRYLLARQQGRATAAPAILSAADRQLLDQLLDLATEQPEAAFVADLERQLNSVAAAQVTAQQRRSFWQRVAHRANFLFQPPRLVWVTIWFFVLLSGGLLLSVPTARAAVWGWLYGFGLVDQQTVEHRPIEVVSPVINPVAPPSLSLREIYRQAPFVVSSPAWLPSGVLYSGGFVIETATGSQVSLIYHRRANLTEALTPATPFLLLIITRGVVEGVPLLPEEQAQTTTVNGRPALYIHGSWAGKSPPTTNNAMTSLQWDSTLDAAWLSWQAADLTYLLYAQDLQLTQTDLMHVAESLHTTPN